VYAKGQQGYLNGSLVVQVTSKGAYLLEFDMGLGEYTCVGDWLAASNAGGGSEVVAASVNSTQIVLALNGGRIVTLFVEAEKFVVSL
jgi:DNA damage-binding protein 1